MRTLFERILEALKISKKEKVEELSGLDKILNGEEEYINDYDNIFKTNGPKIYAFVTNKVKDAIKIGYTDQYVQKRLDQWKKYYGYNEGDIILLGCWSSEEFDNTGQRVFFWDHPVHNKVVKRGFENIKDDPKNPKHFSIEDLTDEAKDKVLELHFSKEFFRKYHNIINNETGEEEKVELSKQLLEDILNEMKDLIRKGKSDFKLNKFDEEGNTSTENANINWKKPANYKETKLQEEAIESGVKAINNGKKSLLMAAVMRFGKTHACYEIIRRKNLKLVIVTSAKADVITAWRDDINHVNYYKDFVFVSFIKGEKYKFSVTKYNEETDRLITEETADIPDAKHIIIFDTLQDLAGSLENLKSKHKGFFNVKYDMMIVDETHYGSHSEKLGRVTGLASNLDLKDEDLNGDINDEIEEIEKDKKIINGLHIKYDVLLQVSGTPYYILASNEMNGLINKDSEIICKVSYSDMLQARDKWKYENPDKQEEDSPYYGIPTLHKIGLNLTKRARKIAGDMGISFSINKLFVIEDNKFKYEDEIKELMKSIFGNDNEESLSLLKNKIVDGKKVCKHTMIILPFIEVCKKMEILLNEILGNTREVICVVDNKDIQKVDSLNSKLNELENHNRKSIILTVNKFLTGVSIPYLDSMIFMKDSSSPQDYDQAIFRLCTRYVKKVKDEEDNEKNTPKLVNMKENVYLIDFNIANMFKMLQNSAKMKAENNDDYPEESQIERIKKYMEEDLNTVPIYTENNYDGTIAEKMHKLNLNDLLKVYAGYNEYKSINDITEGEINKFNKLFSDKEFQKLISDIDITGDTSKIEIKGVNQEGEDELPGLDKENEEDELQGLDGEKDKEHNSLKKYINKSKEETKKENKIKKETREKFTSLIKKLLYCNICYDNPYTDVESILKNIDKDEEFKKILDEFEVNVKEVRDVYNYMDNQLKEYFNKLLLNISLIAEDDLKKNDGIERFLNSISGLSKISQSEVITPPNITKKMVKKLNPETYRNAESIILVNEKAAEFFRTIYSLYGKSIADKCKIVYSSGVGKNLTIKILKNMGIKNYNDYIFELEDKDGNNKINIEDFEKLPPSEIMEQNNNRKFDICLMNPPYATTGGGTIHLQFVEKMLQCSKEQVVIMPFRFVTNIDNKQNNKFKPEFDKYLVSVEQQPKDVFKSVDLNDSSGTAIYHFSDKKTGNIKIKYLDKEETEIDSLINVSNYSSYEKGIIEWLSKNYKQKIIEFGNLHGQESKLKNIPEDKTYEEVYKEILNKNSGVRKLKQLLDENPGCYGLIVSRANGSKNAKCFTSKNGQILSDYEDFYNVLLNNKSNIGYNVIFFKSKEAAENAKVALNNPLIRFTFFREQKDKSMTTKIYQYVPHIDWEDERCRTDVGLLELCGCPKDKAEEYAEYCKEIIEKVDKK